MRIVTIIGSAHPSGNTIARVQELSEYISFDSVNLKDYQIGEFDYTHKNRNDDFLPLMKKLIMEYDVFVFATPVYWYSMSGIMKTFFDRLSDLLKIEKDLGRKLRGKSMAALSSSNGNNLGDAFWLPFSETAEYLGMHYLGNVHTYDDQDAKPVLMDFARQLNAQPIS